MAFPTAGQAAAVKALVATYGAPSRVVIERSSAPYARVMVVWPVQRVIGPDLAQPRVVLIEPNGDRVFFDPTPYDITA